MPALNHDDSDEDYGMPVSERSSDDEREVWVIRVCPCGFPLGATRAAIALKVCPDCERPTIPVEDRTRSVTVYAR